MIQTRTSRRLAAEFVLIVVSILAAFAVEELRQVRAQRALKTQALSNVREGIMGNLTALEAVDRMVDHVFTRGMFRIDETEASLRLLGAMASELYAQELQLHDSLEALLAEIP